MPATIPNTVGPTLKRFLLVQFVLLTALIALSLLRKLADLPHHLLGAAPTSFQQQWTEVAVESCQPRGETRRATTSSGALSLRTPELVKPVRARQREAQRAEIPAHLRRRGFVFPSPLRCIAAILELKARGRFPREDDLVTIGHSGERRPGRGGELQLLNLFQ